MRKEKRGKKNRLLAIIIAILLVVTGLETIQPMIVDAKVGSGNTYLANYECHYTLTGKTKEMSVSETPVGKHGALSVKGVNLVDKYGESVILRGASTHGMHWGEMTPFVNKTAFQNLRDEWGVNMIRLVSYVTQGGYTQGSKDILDTSIQKGVQYATDLGMYAMIDWHIHAENPNNTINAAKSFFEKYSKMYASHNNVIYEICNEPTSTPWPQIKKYAEAIVKIIRKNDPDAIIVVGTNTWSQDVDEVATNGGKLNDDNTMYSVHFYAGTHGQSLRDKVSKALSAGTPIFCTEFGICDSSGNGGFNTTEANKWISFFESKKISYTCWSLCNKDESASMISPSSSKKSGWTNGDLGATGAWVVTTYRNYSDKEKSVQSSTGDNSNAGSTSTSSIHKKQIHAVKVSAISKKVYTGKAIKPSVKVKYGSKVLKKGTDYKVSYSNNKKVGKATVKITGINQYKGVKKVTFNIIPKKPTKVKVISNRKDSITVSYKKVAGVTGYKIEYSTKKSFAKKKMISTSKGKKTIENIRASKYYIRVRAYKKVGSKVYYSKYTKMKRINVK